MEPAAVEPILGELRSELVLLRTVVQQRLSYDQVKEEAFERLYAELDGYKKNATFEQVRPLYLDLVLLLDRIEILRADAAGGDASQVVASLLDSIRDELLEALARREVEVMRRDSAEFDPSYQRAVGAVPVADRALHNMVERVVRRGFAWRDRVIRAEEVYVRRHEGRSEPQVGVSSQKPRRTPEGTAEATPDRRGEGCE
jgi:molecular chaperone GrpE